MTSEPSVSRGALQDISQLAQGADRVEVALNALRETNLSASQIKSLLKLAETYGHPILSMENSPHTIRLQPTQELDKRRYDWPVGLCNLGEELFQNLYGIEESSFVCKISCIDLFARLTLEVVIGDPALVGSEFTLQIQSTEHGQYLQKVKWNDDNTIAFTDLPFDNISEWELTVNGKHLHLMEVPKSKGT